MESNVPLHSLVFSTSSNLRFFPPHEILAKDVISQQLIGAGQRDGFPQVVFGEIRHLTALKLSLGERVVLPFRDFSSDQLQQLSSIAACQGAKVFGFGISHLGQPLAASPEVVKPFPPSPTIRQIGQRWNGITAIGDVHGEISPLEQALDWAKSRNHLAWFLGDIVDYGKQTLAVMERVYDAVMAGDAVMMLANHERKIARLLNNDSANFRISEGNRVTIDAYERLPSIKRAQWAGKFRALLAHTASVRCIGDLVLMHAAAHPSLWSQHDALAIEHFALYGESEQANNSYRRTHHWVDHVPAGKTVVVGHDMIFQYPIIVQGQRGGKVIFLDTGCGKGGHLSSADFRISNDKLVLECFKRY